MSIDIYLLSTLLEFFSNKPTPMSAYQNLGTSQRPTFQRQIFLTTRIQELTVIYYGKTERECAEIANREWSERMGARPRFT